jgi:hypothetical protein
MKLFLILCALLAFVRADFVDDLRSIQKDFKYFTPDKIDGEANIPDATKKDFKCFLNEIQKDENFERFNVSAIQKLLHSFILLIDLSRRSLII